MNRKLTFFLIAIIILICSRFAYQYTERVYGKDSIRKVILPVPLSNFPAKIEKWTSQEMPLSEAVQKVAGNDDYINRQYINRQENKWASFYVAYTGQPRNMLGHRPTKCYVGAGWILQNTEFTQFTSVNGNTYPCLVHYFNKPKPESTSIVVLNYYILNGVPTNKESEFNSLAFRLPNVEGEIARYVAQIQISSTVESNVLDLAALSADIIIKYLPDKDGFVPITNKTKQENTSVN